MLFTNMHFDLKATNREKSAWYIQYENTEGFLRQPCHLL
jgi:hypothetical protein